jgi:hypothetical protein
VALRARCGGPKTTNGVRLNTPVWHPSSIAHPAYSSQRRPWTFGVGPADEMVLVQDERLSEQGPRARPLGTNSDSRTGHDPRFCICRGKADGEPAVHGRPARVASSLLANLGDGPALNLVLAHGPAVGRTTDLRPNVGDCPLRH